MSQFYMDIAASIQDVCQDVLYHLVLNLRKLTNSDNLCLSGGVALNCVANGFLKKTNLFEQIWVQPASGDAGTSVGAAYAVYYASQVWSPTASGDRMNNCRLGPRYTNSEIIDLLNDFACPYSYKDDNSIFDYISVLIGSGNVVGWFDGSMEFGPRALGGRSILGDPRNPSMQKNMNLKIKFRESFRPFAPSILQEKCAEYFDDMVESPYMLFTTQVKSLYNSSDHIEFPAITHVDGSARVQTVNPNSAPRFYKLLKSFYARTGCPMLINTSFNLRGEPIVCSPLDAFDCFMRSDIDYLVLQNYIVQKTSLPQELISRYTKGNVFFD